MNEDRDTVATWYRALLIGEWSSQTCHMINRRFAFPSTPIPTPARPAGMNLFTCKRHAVAVAVASPPATAPSLTTTSRRASSSGTSGTVTGWWRQPSPSQGLPCRCRSPRGRSTWTHLEGKGKVGCDGRMNVKQCDCVQLSVSSNPTNVLLRVSDHGPPQRTPGGRTQQRSTKRKKK